MRKIIAIGVPVGLCLIALAVFVGLRFADDNSSTTTASVSIPTQQSQSSAPTGGGIEQLVGTWKSADDTSDSPTTVTIAADGNITNDSLTQLGCVASVMHEGQAYKVTFNCDNLGYSGSVTPEVSADGTTITVGKGDWMVSLVKVTSS